MYACVTDYSFVYHDACKAWRDENIHFKQKVLPKLIASFCSGKDLRKNLDICGGIGSLGSELAQFGIETVTTEICALPGSSVVSFNLTKSVKSAASEILRARNAGTEAYLTTCLGVLEQIDREHLSAAVHNLAVLTDRYLIISVATQPATINEMFQATLLPVNAWIHAFEAAGFKLEKVDIFADAQRQDQRLEKGEDCLVDHWRKANIFRDNDARDPRYLLFEKKGKAPPYKEFEEISEQVLDIAYRRRKRQAFVPAAELNFNFNICHSQDWSLLRPFLDVLPRNKVRILMRPGMFHPKHERAMCSFIRRCNITLIKYDDVKALPWNELKGEILLSGAESTNRGSHLRSFELVSTARLHGCCTFLLQHGIWPRPFEDQIITFASERVFTWGVEEQRRLNGMRHEMLGAEVPWGVLDDEQNASIGSAKFCDQLLEPLSPLNLKFGYGSEDFENVVVFGSKNLRGRWGLPNKTQEFLRDFGKICAENPQTLFIVRPHPADNIEPFGSLERENVRLFDDIVSALADMPLNRIIPSVDLLITSPSSFVIDAAISSKPLFVYETGQPIEIECIKAKPLDALVSCMGDIAGYKELHKQSIKLKAKYAEAVDDRFYNLAAEEFVRRKPPQIDRSAAAMATLAHMAVSNTKKLKSKSPKKPKINRLLERISLKKARSQK